MISKCFLKCLNNSHAPILLENLIPVILGRSKSTKIKNSRCSKEQVELTANCEDYKVIYKHLGSNEGRFKGKATKCGDINQVFHKDVIELLSGLYPHEVIFDPEPPTAISQPNCNESNTCEKLDFPEKKRKEDGQTINMSKRKRNSPAKELDKKKKCNDESENLWETFNNSEVLIYNKHLPKSDKIAAYDMDGTLITTVSGRVFPKDINDWKILYAEVPGKLKQLSKDGFKIVLFTNQLGVSKGKVKVEDIQSKITKILNKIGVSAQALVSTGKGKYRKPMTGMWEFFIKECNDGMKADKIESFYVGDAAGRSEIPKQKKKDHSIADRLFALNIGIQFYTPEEHFLGHKPLPYKMPEFIPTKIDPSVSLYNPSSTKVPNYPVEVILLVGFPGSGKSTFVEMNLLKKGYIQANRDTIGSWQKCVSLMEKSIKDGKHVVIDNTNPDKESRSRYIDAAKRENIPIRCFLLDVTLNQAKHNNKFREITGSEHSKVNDMIYNMYKSKYQEPSLEEGFNDIVRVNFVPSFKTTEMEHTYKMFLLET